MPRSKSSRQKTHNIRRKRARQKWIKELMQVHKCRCFDCGVWLVTFVNVQKRRKDAKIERGLVTWTTPSGAKAQCHMATVEHLIRVASGGGNEWENVTLLCHNCNQRRDWTSSEKLSPWVASPSTHLRQSLQLPLQEALKRLP